MAESTVTRRAGLAISPSADASTALERADVVFNNIAELAHTIHAIAMDQISCGGENFEEYKAVAIRELASKLGLLAEIGGRNCGTGGYYGDVEQWLLPGRYQDLSKGQQHG